MEWLSFLVDLARAFFKAFAHAVQEYPLPTAAVVAISFFVVWPQTKRKFHGHEIPAGLVQFVLTVVVANVIGFIFDITFKVVQFILEKIFGMTQTSLSIFADHPIQFLEHLLFWTIVVCIVLLQIGRWKYKNIEPRWLYIAVLPLLWTTYVTTNVHAHIIKTQTTPSNAAAPAKT